MIYDKLEQLQEQVLLSRQGTAETNEDNLNEHVDDAHSTPQPPTTEMLFDSFE
jgi:hypothetical protein